MQAMPVSSSDDVKIGFRPHRSMTSVQNTNEGISTNDVKIDDTNWKHSLNAFAHKSML
jgi:hypothetical protein